MGSFSEEIIWIIVVKVCKKHLARIEILLEKITTLLKKYRKYIAQKFSK
jgi:hypothetical protein